jgi:radical SAM PhpK family P-methyltransferase
MNIQLPVLNNADQIPVLTPSTTTDCIVIGYNDLDFDEFARAQKEMNEFSGAYCEAKYNSVLLDGRRITYMDLMNHAVTKATGTDPRLNVFEAPSLGACYLVSFLRKRGLNAELVNFFNKERDALADMLARGPNAVAITTTYYVDPAPVIDIVKFIRRHNEQTKIIVGGPFIYHLCLGQDDETQDYLLQSIGADIYIFDSQGERSLSQVCAVLRDPDRGDLSSVPNLIYTFDNEEFQRTPRKIEDNELDENAVDWSYFDADLFNRPIYLRTAISCPFACSFCAYPTVAGEHKLLSVEVVERQLRYIHSMGTKQVVFVDDTFNVPLPRFKQLLRMMIQNEFNFQWMSFFRCSNADDEAFDLMRQSGCVGVFLGIESGDQDILNNMNKFANTKKYKEGIRKLNERGIATFASIIAGFPGETQQSIMNTVQFLQEAAPTFFNIQLYYHDLETPIHKQAAKYNIRGAGYSWSHATMDWKEASSWVEYIYNNVHSSIPLTLYGFSIWSLPYLISKGITVEQVKQFGTIARELLLQSFNDVEPADFTVYESRLISVFQNN